MQPSKKNQTTDNVLSLMMTIIIVVMFVQVLFRYVFNHSLSWSEELAKFVFIWMTFLGAAICIKERMHIGVEFLVERLPEKWKKHVAVFNTSLVVAFNLALSIIGFFWVWDVSGTLSPAMGLPLNIVFYAALPVAAVLSVIYGIMQLIGEIRNHKL